MATLSDPDRSAAYLNAAANGTFEGYIRFDLNGTAFEYVRGTLGVTLPELKRLIAEHVNGGGEIDEVAETRSNWSGEYSYHYDLRFVIEGVPVYVETRLLCRIPFIPDEPRIEVVNIHGQ